MFDFCSNERNHGFRPNLKKCWFVNTQPRIKLEKKMFFWVTGSHVSNPTIFLRLDLGRLFSTEVAIPGSFPLQTVFYSFSVLSSFLTCYHLSNSYHENLSHTSTAWNSMYLLLILTVLFLCHRKSIILEEIGQ